MSRLALLLGLVVGCDTPTDSGDTAEDTDTAVPDTGDGTLTDPLSMPAEPTLDPADFPTSDTCASCHPDHVAQWSTSTHAYAIDDPLFQALVGLRQAHFAGAQDRFCTQCHSAIGVRGGEIAPGFSFDALSPVVREGVTCVACHLVTDVERPYNSGHVLDAGAPMQGPIEAPVANAQHLSAESALFEGAELCGGCHDVIEPSGLDLERPYAEWLESPARDDGRVCQDCHMLARTGQAATTGPARTLHDHRFVGLDNPTGDPELQAAIEALLTDIASVELVLPEGVVAGDTLPVTVDVHNRIEGHNLPTGSTFLRELWLEVVVTDAEGGVVYESGTLGADGDLRGYWSASDPYGDPDLVTFGSGLIDSFGEPTLFPWLASEHWSAAIPPGYHRAATWFVPTAGLAGPLSIDVRLRLRPFPPFLLRAVALDAMIADVHIYDLASTHGTVDVR